MILVSSGGGAKLPVRGDVVALRSAPKAGGQAVEFVQHEGATLFQVGDTGADGLVDLDPAVDVHGTTQGLVHFFSPQHRVRVSAGFLEGAPVLFHGDVWSRP